MQPVEYFLHHGHLWYRMGLHIHQQQQENIQNSFTPVVVTCTKTSNKSGISINKPMNYYSPANETCLMVKGINQDLRHKVDYIACWPSWCHNDMGPGTEYTLLWIWILWNTHCTGSILINDAQMHSWGSWWPKCCNMPSSILIPAHW